MEIIYEIDKYSLLELSKKIYEEACLGYMDLRDSVCENLLEEFLEDKVCRKKENSTNLSPLDLSSNEFNVDLVYNEMSNLNSGTGFSGPAIENNFAIDYNNNMFESEVFFANIPEENIFMQNYYTNESERM